MAVQVSFPGVYIEEFTPGAPITGVGKSTAAFVGPASNGPLNEPTKITSWDAFRAAFGEEPLPGFYLWHAVRGFFMNGGQVCYVVRASNGRYASVAITNGANPALTLATARARQPGEPSPDITVEVKAPSARPTTSVYRATGTYTVDGPQAVKLVSASEAAQYRPGDWVRLAAPDTRVQVTSISGDTLRLGTPIAAALASIGTLRLADSPAGARTVRLKPDLANPLAPGALAPGTMLTITQGTSDTQIVDSVQIEQLATSTPSTTYRVTFRQGLAIAIDLSGTAATASVKWEEFNIEVSQGGAPTVFPGLSVDPDHPRYFIDVINQSPSPVRLILAEPPPTTTMPKNLPVGQFTLVDGEPEDLSKLGDDLSNLGDIYYTNALDTLKEIDDVNLIAIPDKRTDAVQQAMIAHCEQLADRFAILDARPGLKPFGAGTVKGVDTQRRSVDSTRGYAALYYPWLRVPSARAGAPILVPPSGHICGIIARSDVSRGVHKAPANEIINGAVGIETGLSDIDQGQLNLAGINVIRIFQGGRPVLWGARTTATDKNWQYVNVRRLFLFLEESIEEGIRWAVFEPNNFGLWQKLKRSITAFLKQQWHDGALFGAKPEDAFYVRIDEVLNPFSEQALGKLHIEIGVRPAYPAEFIIVRIGIWDGGAVVTEV